MAIASFEELCAGFCELAGVPAPQLKADAQGIIAFHVILRGVTVDMVHCPERCPSYAFILFEFGPFGHDGLGNSSQLGELLDANFLTLQAYPPVFSRNPVNGEALLQYVYPFFEATPTGLLELVNSGVQKALRWSEGVKAEPEAKIHKPQSQYMPGMPSGFA